MPGLALAMYVTFLAVALGWRSWLQYRRTGDHGLRGFSGGQWCGGGFLAAGTILSGVAAAAELADLVDPIAALDSAWLHRIGVLLAFLGCAIAIVAQLQMRDSWRVGVNSQEATPLVTEGLFRLVRNPIYSGALLASGGLLLMVPNVLSVVAVVVLVVGLEVHVRGVEEPYLTRVHGKTYLAYARRVGRFVPLAGFIRHLNRPDGSRY